MCLFWDSILCLFKPYQQHGFKNISTESQLCTTIIGNNLGNDQNKRNVQTEQTIFVFYTIFVHNTYIVSLQIGYGHYLYMYCIAHHMEIFQTVIQTVTVVLLRMSVRLSGCLRI